MKHAISLAIDHTPTVPEPASFPDAMAAMDAAHARRDRREHWILDTIHSSDRFMRSCIGYWARGHRVIGARRAGWLVYEMDDRGPSDAEVDTATGRLIRGVALPTGWYWLDRAAAGRCYDAMVAHRGVDWYDDGDATAYDVAIQLGLLGEVRYG